MENEMHIRDEVSKINKDARKKLSQVILSIENKKSDSQFDFISAERPLVQPKRAYTHASEHLHS